MIAANVISKLRPASHTDRHHVCKRGSSSGDFDRTVRSVAGGDWLEREAHQLGVPVEWTDHSSQEWAQLQREDQQQRE
jgi:hypothetical protein